MVSILFFKSCVTKTDVCFLRFQGGDLCLVDNVCHVTVSDSKGAGILVPAIA